MSLEIPSQADLAAEIDALDPVTLRRLRRAEKAVANLIGDIADADDEFGERYARESTCPTFAVWALGARLHGALRHAREHDRHVRASEKADRAIIADLEQRLARAERARLSDLTAFAHDRQRYREAVAGLLFNGHEGDDGIYGDIYRVEHGDEPLAVWMAAARLHAATRRIRERERDDRAAAVARRDRIAALELRLAELEAPR